MTDGAFDTNPAALLAALRPGHVLSAEDIDLLHRLREEPWQARQRRLDARDRAIREVRPCMAGHEICAHAAELAISLRRFLNGQDPVRPRVVRPSAEQDYRDAIRQIAALNNDKVLGERQIYNAMRGTRSGRH